MTTALVITAALVAGFIAGRVSKRTLTVTITEDES